MFLKRQKVKREKRMVKKEKWVEKEKKRQITYSQRRRRKNPKTDRTDEYKEEVEEIRGETKTGGGKRQVKNIYEKVEEKRKTVRSSQEVKRKRKRKSRGLTNEHRGHR